MAAILLVCTGNICRSPMAEALLRHLLEERRVQGVDVSSCGTMARGGSPATREAEEVLRERGIDLSGHASRPLTPELVASADLVLAMAREHREAVTRLDPGAAPRTFTLKELTRLLPWVTLPAGAQPAERVRAAAEGADRVRRASPGGSVDEDVPDPLGLGIDSYRALAWELDLVCGELVEGLFGDGAGAGSTGEDRGRRRGVEDPEEGEADERVRG